MSHNIGLITDYNDSIDNDKEPCKLQTNSIIMEGCDDNSNIKLGTVIPLESTPRKSNCAIVRSVTSVQASDNDYSGVDNILTSVIHNMNQSRNPGDSL